MAQPTRHSGRQKTDEYGPTAFMSIMRHIFVLTLSELFLVQYAGQSVVNGNCQNDHVIMTEVEVILTSLHPLLHERLPAMIPLHGSAKDGRPRVHAGVDGDSDRCWSISSAPRNGHDRPCGSHPCLSCRSVCTTRVCPRGQLSRVLTSLIGTVLPRLWLCRSPLRRFFKHLLPLPFTPVTPPESYLHARDKTDPLAE